MKEYLLLGLVFCVNNIFAQNFDLINSNLSESLEWESDNDGKNLHYSEIYQLPDEVSQPIRFEHNEDRLPNLITSYFYLKNDSSIYEIEYEWDANNFWADSIHILKEGDLKAFKVRYDSIIKVIEFKYGKAQTDEKEEFLQAIKKGSYHRIDKWYPENLNIIGYIDLSNKYEKHNTYTITPIYRIRFTFTNNYKVKREEPISQTRINNNELKALLFLNSIIENKYEIANALLSDSIRQTTTNSQLRSISKQIKHYKGFSMTYSGIQFGLNSSFNLMLIFQNKNDESNPPKEFIKILFDKEDKIIGIQTFKK